MARGHGLKDVARRRPVPTPRVWANTRGRTMASVEPARLRRSSSLAHPQSAPVAGFRLGPPSPPAGPHHAALMGAIATATPHDAGTAYEPTAVLLTS